MQSLVGREAPNFQAKAINDQNEIVDVCLETILNKNSTKGVVLFFYPLNFTFVCPTELVQLNKTFNEFEKRGIVVMAISVDSKYSHLAWKNMPLTQGGVGCLNYLMVSDIKKEIGCTYGILASGNEVALRATFFIDANGIVRHQSVNDLPIGRNINEIIRIIDAYKHYEKNGEVCQANWQPGSQGFEPSQSGVCDFMTSNYLEE